MLGAAGNPAFGAEAVSLEPVGASAVVGTRLAVATPPVDPKLPEPTPPPAKMTPEEASLACRLTYGAPAFAAKVNADGSYWCTCEPPYALVKEKKACVKKTHRELLKHFSKICAEDFGKASIAVKYDKKAVATCTCKPAHVWNKAKTRCVRYDRRKAAADCRKRFGRRYKGVVRNRDGSYSCSYRKTGKQLRREAWAACRRRYGRRLSNVRIFPGTRRKPFRYECVYRR